MPPGFELKSVELFKDTIKELKEKSNKKSEKIRTL